MIKAEDGKCTINGTVAEILSELLIIMDGVAEAGRMTTDGLLEYMGTASKVKKLMDAGMSEDEACDVVLPDDD